MAANGRLSLAWAKMGLEKSKRRKLGELVYLEGLNATQYNGLAAEIWGDDAKPFWNRNRYGIKITTAGPLHGKTIYCKDANLSDKPPQLDALQLGEGARKRKRNPPVEELARVALPGAAGESDEEQPDAGKKIPSRHRWQDRWLTRYGWLDRRSGSERHVDCCKQ